MLNGKICTSQPLFNPRVNTQHRLARFLDGLWLPLTLAGVDVTGKSKVAVTSGFTLGVSRLGAVVKSEPVGNVYGGYYSNIRSTQRITIVIVGMLRGGGRYWSAEGYESANNASDGLSVRIGTSNGTYTATFPTPVTGNLVVTQNVSNLSVPPIAYCNGVKGTISGTASGSMTISGSFVFMNHYLGTLDRIFSGEFAMAAVIAEQATEDEARQLSLNPWQLFTERSSSIFTPVGESGVLIPDLSSPGVIDTTSTQARPQLKITY